MKSAADLIPEAVSLTPAPDKAIQSTALPCDWIERLFMRLAQMYPGKFLDSIADIGATKVTWGEGLAGISAEEIRRGLYGCLKKPWPPTLPEFRALCRPPRDAEAEFRRAADILGHQPIDWAGDAVLYWTVHAVGPFDIRSRPYEGTLKYRWTNALRTYEDIDNLPAPPEPPTAALECKPTPREQARKHLAAIRQSLGAA